MERYGSWLSLRDDVRFVWSDGGGSNRMGKVMPSPDQDHEGGKTLGRNDLDKVESFHVDQREQGSTGEIAGGGLGAVSRKLVAELSPGKKPPIYGQVFQTEAEVIRQRMLLQELAEALGLRVDDGFLTTIRNSALEETEGQEHEVYYTSTEWVTKVTKADSWASGASPAQYFQRWIDLGILYPDLEPEVLGILEDGRIIVRQKAIQGRVFDSSSSLQAEMERQGWERISGRRYRHHESKAEISDVSSSNVILGEDGAIWPFDVVVQDLGSKEPSADSLREVEDRE